jgi:hypothetical protein
MNQLADASLMYFLTRCCALRIRNRNESIRTVCVCIERNPYYQLTLSLCEFDVLFDTLLGGPGIRNKNKSIRTVCLHQEKFILL